MCDKIEFSKDKRKHRREHRRMARFLIKSGTLFNARSPVGSTPWNVARWHLQQARRLER